MTIEMPTSLRNLETWIEIVVSVLGRIGVATWVLDSASGIDELKSSGIGKIYLDII
jgi:hypothetical protein